MKIAKCVVKNFLFVDICFSRNPTLGHLPTFEKVNELE